MPVTKTTKPSKVAGPKSLAELFDEADPLDASNLLPEGEHEVRLNSMVLKEDPKKGAGVTAEYESISGDEEGKKVRQFYKLTDADKQKAPGLAYLKRDLALLGYEDAAGAKLKKVLETIGEKQPMVIINVKVTGQYVNAYLAGLAGDADDTSGTESEGETVELEVGAEVTWDDSGETKEGKISKIKGDSAIVIDSDGTKCTVDLSDLSAKTEEEETASQEIEVGSKVKWNDSDGDDQTGVVIKLKGDKVLVQKADKSKENVDLDDLSLNSEEEVEEEEVAADDEIAVGDEVIYNDDGAKGTVKKVLPDKFLITDGDGDDIKVSKDKCEKVAAPADDEIEVGSEVTWEDDGETKTGKVKVIDEKKATAKVKDDEGVMHSVKLNALEKVE